MDKIVCPDCGQVLETIHVQRYTYQSYTLDYDKQEMKPLSEETHEDDTVFRCPSCDTLNVDSMFNNRWKICL